MQSFNGECRCKQCSCLKCSQPKRHFAVHYVGIRSVSGLLLSYALVSFICKLSQHSRGRHKFIRMVVISS